MFYILIMTNIYKQSQCGDSPEVRSTMTFMATYSYLSTRSRRRCSVKFSIRSMQAPSPRSLAWAREMDLPRLTRISPGVDIDRKQQENSRSSHHALISNEIWSSICIIKCCLRVFIFIMIVIDSHVLFPRSLSMVWCWNTCLTCLPCSTYQKYLVPHLHISSAG